MLIRKLVWRLKRYWPRFWMRVAGIRYCRRIATHLAQLWVPPYFQRHFLADLNPRGFISARAKFFGARIQLGANVFIDDRVMIYQEPDGGPVEIGDCARLHDDTYILVTTGGSVYIGAGTNIHRGCQLDSHKVPIRIGCRVEIGPRCAFHSFDHGLAPDRPIAEQPLTTKGPIIIEDEAWLGYGVIVLSGVRIGKGAVIGAGSVVTKDVPAGAIAVGVPARVMRMRADLRPGDRSVAEGLQLKGDSDCHPMQSRGEIVSDASSK